MATSNSLMEAVIIGGTGATGKCLVRTLLLAKDKVAKVTLLSRKPLPPIEGVDLSAEESQGRLVQNIEGLDNIGDDKVKQLCSGGTVFFSTMGTTISLFLFGSTEDFRHIAYETPARIMRLAHEAGVPHCSFITGMVADVNASSLNARLKGELEALGKELFSRRSAFRPGFLDREENSGYLERLFSLFVSGLPVSTLAAAMFLDAWEYHKKRQSAQTPEGDGGTTAAPDDSNTIDILYNDDIYQIYRKNEDPDSV